MEQEKIGIKESAELLEFLGAFASQTDAVLADGKVVTTELIGYWTTLTKVKPAIEGLKEVPRELADLDDTERFFLVSVLADVLKMRRTDVELIFEDGFDLALRNAQFIKRVGQLRRPTPEAVA
jgi:hypothetical protein